MLLLKETNIGRAYQLSTNASNATHIILRHTMCYSYPSGHMDSEGTQRTPLPATEGIDIIDGEDVSYGVATIQPFQLCFVLRYTCVHPCTAFLFQTTDQSPATTYSRIDLLNMRKIQVTLPARFCTHGQSLL
jgi:hypothetical protein